MTEINFIKEVEKKETSYLIELKGHSDAERNTMENDLCCCACSVLACTLTANLIEKYKNADVEECSGYLKIELKLNEKKEIEEAETIINAFFYGFEMTEKKYPDNVKIDRKIKIKKC